jgi:hypothetical protein
VDTLRKRNSTDHVRMVAAIRCVVRTELLICNVVVEYKSFSELDESISLGDIADS